MAGDRRPTPTIRVKALRPSFPLDRAHMCLIAHFVRGYPPQILHRVTAGKPPLDKVRNCSGTNSSRRVWLEPFDPLDLTHVRNDPVQVVRCQTRDGGHVTEIPVVGTHTDERGGHE